MTTFKKVLWRIAGIVPLVANVFATAFILPLNYYSGTRERIGIAAWIVLFALSLLVLVPLILWNAYCAGRSKGTIPTGWQGYFDLFHTKTKTILILLGIMVVLWIAAILYFR
jgi:hypothetical protein